MFPDVPPPDKSNLAASSAPSSIDRDALAQCIAIAVEASQVENKAMEFDRAGNASEAVAQYREAAARLVEAVTVCPEGHPDRTVLDNHAGEVMARCSYLENLGNNLATVPLEEHIHGVQLTMGSPASGGSAASSSSGAADASSSSSSGTSGPIPVTSTNQAVAAAGIGGAAGLLIAGPIGLMAGAAGAAYATTRQGSIGETSRKVGDAGLTAANRAKAVADEHRVTEKVTLAYKTAESQAKALDENFKLQEKAQVVSQRTSEALSVGARRATDFNEKHKVTDKLNQGVSVASSTISGWIGKATEAASAATTRRSSDATSSPQAQ